MFSPALVDKVVTFADPDTTGDFFCWFWCPLAVIYDSGIYFDIIFSVIPGYVTKDPYLILWSRVRLDGQ